MKPKRNTDDQSTVSMKRRSDASTVKMPLPGGKKSPPSQASDAELTLIHSYWRSGSAALKRQAVSRYAQLMKISAEGAEAALSQWAHQQDQSK